MMLFNILIVLGLALGLALMLPGVSVGQVALPDAGVDVGSGLTILGIPAEYVAIVVAIVILCERISKVIPDSAGGSLGAIRKVLKIIGAYTPNR